WQRAVAVDLEDGYVGERIFAEQSGVDIAPIRESDRDLFSPSYDMLIRDDDAITPDDESGPERLSWRLGTKEPGCHLRLLGRGGHHSDGDHRRCHPRGGRNQGRAARVVNLLGDSALVDLRSDLRRLRLGVSGLAAAAGCR